MDYYIPIQYSEGVVGLKLYIIAKLNHINLTNIFKIF